MIVIDGYRGKSRRLEEILKEKKASKENTIILDTVGIPSLVDFGQCYRVDNLLNIARFLFDYNYVDAPFGIEIDRESLKYIVLETNASRKMIDLYKSYEQSTGKELIVTIQCPADEAINEIQVYEV